MDSLDAAFVASVVRGGGSITAAHDTAVVAQRNGAASSLGASILRGYAVLGRFWCLLLGMCIYRMSGLNCFALQGRKYTQAGSRARGFSRMLRRAWFIPPDYHDVPICKPDGGVGMGKLAILSPRRVVQRLAAEYSPALLYGDNTLEQQHLFWQRR